MSASALAVVASVAVFVLGAVLAHAETADDARLRQLAGQAASYAGDVRALLAKGADPNVPDRAGRTAVHGAAAISAAETMQALLDAGGNPNRRDKDGNTPLHLASVAARLIGAVATIRLLLRAEADPGIANGEGRTALHLVVAHYEQPEVVEALLAHGADANRRDRWGSTPLHAALGHNPGWPGWSGAGFPGIVRALLAGGADPRLTNGDGLPALQLFVREGIGSRATAAMLIEAGADPNRKYPNGEAPLHAAIRTGGTRGKAAVAEELLAGGADPCIRDAQGFIPYSIATEGGPIHRALDRARGHDLACQGQGEAISLDSDQQRRIQLALASAGYDPGPADGKFGPRTRRAIEGWQQANGYAPTGELTNTQSETLLTDPSPRSASREEIREAQSLLAALGYAPGPADGRWGSRSMRAYEAFLRDASMLPAVTLNPDTLQALRDKVNRRQEDADTAMVTDAASSSSLDVSEAPGRLCADDGDDTDCWREIAENPGCHLWVVSSKPNRTRESWSGSCDDGAAKGKGTLVTRWENGNALHETVTILGGRRHGKATARSTRGSVSEGEYDDGVPVGKWVSYDGDGKCINAKKLSGGEIISFAADCNNFIEIRKPTAAADEDTAIRSGADETGSGCADGPICQQTVKNAEVVLERVGELQAAGNLDITNNSLAIAFTTRASIACMKACLEREERRTDCRNGLQQAIEELDKTYRSAIQSARAASVDDDYVDEFEASPQNSRFGRRSFSHIQGNLDTCGY